MGPFVKSTKSAEGTCLYGYLNASYKILVELFGAPSTSDQYKVSTEWILEDQKGNVFTIYDYKETNLYDENNPSVEEFRALPTYEWHVGGRTKLLTLAAIAELEELIRRNM